jgi:hypothetical protein
LKVDHLHGLGVYDFVCDAWLFREAWRKRAVLAKGLAYVVSDDSAEVVAKAASFRSKPSDGGSVHGTEHLLNHVVSEVPGEFGVGPSQEARNGLPVAGDLGPVWLCFTDRGEGGEPG